MPAFFHTFSRTYSRIRNLEETDIPGLDSLTSGYRSEVDELLRQCRQLRGEDLVEAEAAGEGAGEKRRTLKKQAATKRLLFSRLPKVLCLHLGRRVSK